MHAIYVLIYLTSFCFSFYDILFNKGVKSENEIRGILYANLYYILQYCIKKCTLWLKLTEQRNALMAYKITMSLRFKEVCQLHAQF